MNKFLTIIIILTFNNCKLQKNVNLYYKEAFNYISKFPEIEGKGLNVANTIVYIEMSNFFEDLSEGDPEAMLFKLDSLDRERNFNTYVLPELLNLPSDTSSNFTLFFSKVNDNTLLAEVLGNYGIKNASYERLTAFNTSRVFLFLFDNENQISKVYNKEIQYD